MIADGGEPYPGLREYREDESALFFGRERLTRVVINNVLTTRLTVLYGGAGTGKSSLLRAGVASQLRTRGAGAVVIQATWRSDPSLDLKEAVSQELRRVSASLPLDIAELDLPELLTRGGNELAGPIVVLLDQFEDYLLYGGAGAMGERFDAEIARAVNQPTVPARFLLAIREDVLARLDRLSGRIPSIFDNYLRLDALTESEARDAMRRPLETYSTAGEGMAARIDDDLVEDILLQVGGRSDVIATPSGTRRAPVEDDETNTADVDSEGEPATQRRVNMPYMQLVLQRLWVASSSDRPRVLGRATLERLGGAERILHTHFSSIISALRTEQQEVAARLFRFLVTPSGKTNAYSSAELASYAEVPVGDVEPVLRRMAEPDVRILRQVATADSQQNLVYYEVGFDILAKAALTWRARYIALGASQWRRYVMTLGLMALAVTLIEVLVTPPNILLLVTRSVAYLALSTLLLVQVYRWFLRYVSMTGFLSIRTFRSPLIGIAISVLFSVLWYASTNLTESSRDWPGRVNTLGFVAFCFTLLVSVSLGTVCFSLMNFLGQISAARFHTFDVGLYAAFAVSCVVLALAIAVALISPQHGVLLPVRLSQVTFCPGGQC
ncbi:MAG: hypothetical protein NVSMB2_11200 [Chloroflexota bacterium]